MTFTCKLQLEIIKDFMEGKTPKFWGFGEKTAISTDGVVAAIFDPEELVFDLSMDQCVELGSHMDKYYELFEKASPVKRTMEYKVFNSYLLEKFHCDENEPFDVYIQKSWQINSRIAIFLQSLQLIQFLRSCHLAALWG